MGSHWLIESNEMQQKLARKFSPILIFAVLLISCDSDVMEAYEEKPVVELYNKAMDSLEAEKLKAAATQFDEVERQHPYSMWATKAQLMSAYTYYQANRYDDAIAALERFIQLHPVHNDTPYAHYLKGLCYYEQISDVARDQKMTELAMNALEDVIKKFPNSKYAKDARLKLDLTVDHLAGKEMEIGRFYQTNGHLLAAVNRFRIVVDRFDTTTHTPEALHRLTECYLSLGLSDEAKKSAAVLGHNFPGSEWYIDSYEIIEGKKVRADKVE
ncbi:MAG: Outer membrane protein assembly factor BamD, partial [Alphaproteobacteria bacterium MarineAlpha3_Bin5]